MDYAQKSERYIEILHKTRELVAPKFDPSITDEELLALIQQNASDSLQYTKESNRILDELLFSRTPESLTDEDIEALSAFAGRLFKYANSDDASLAHRIHLLLLETARCRRDEVMYIKELYFCGITLFYSEPLRVVGITMPNSARMRGYFEEGSKYLARYEEFDKTTRGYIVRCLGNCRLAMPRVTEDDVAKYYRAYDRAMAVICSPYYRSLDPDLPWDNFEYSMNSDQITMMFYLNHHYDPKGDIAQRVWRAANYVYSNKYLYTSEEARLQNWRMKYFYEAARYNVGKRDARYIVDALLTSSEAIKYESYDPLKINDYIYRLVYAIYYLKPAKKELSGPPYLMHLHQRNKLDKRMKAAMRRSIDMLVDVPFTTAPRIINTAIQQLMDAVPEVDGLDMRMTLDTLMPRHRPTYIHSLMVAMLTERLVRRLVQTDPAALIGVSGYMTAEDIQQHDEELCTLAYNCGLYHDLGKGMIFMFVANNSRRLTDEEFNNIKLHPEIGSYLIKKLGLSDDLANAAMYHHRFFDGNGGYPAHVGECPKNIKGIVDALTVADSMDAATDSIGRCFSSHKPYKALVAEMRSQAGTRYSPAVMRLFDNKFFFNELFDVMQDERRQIYVRIYREDSERKKRGG